MNNYSLILLLEYRGTRILLPGDTNYMGYGGLDPASLRADLFKVGHHGQRDGISAEQIQAIAPRAVVCCASSDRRYNSADPAILQMMADSGARLYFSDCPPGPDGAVPAPPSGPDVHSRRRRRNGGHIPVHPGLNPRSNTTYPSAPALHILPGAGRKKEENPAWLAVRQCGDLPQRRTGPRPAVREQLRRRCFQSLISWQKLF